MEPKPFKYSPLTAHDSIRLILVQPSPTPEAPIHCTLLHTTLSQCSLDIITPFTALSYVWGSPLQTGLIYLDSQPFTVTLSLFSALRDLRDSTRVLRLWADALCIDQSNPTERGSQVSLMGEIYSTANHTVIHLSPNVEAPIPAHISILSSLTGNTSGHINTDLNKQELIQLAETTLLTATWFTRVWVFQELVLSGDPWVQSSTIRARWSTLCDLLLSSGLTQSSSGLQLLSSMNLARGPHRRPLLSYLSTRRGLGATNPIDMIYSHLGLISDVPSLTRYVPVDYTLSCASIYEDCARYFLENLGPSGTDTFIPLCSQNYLSKMEGLASWAPDWSLPPSELGVMYRDNIISTLRLPPAPYFAFTSTAPRTLSWIGYRVGTVGELSHIFPSSSEIKPSEEYQAAAEKLRAIYHSAGIWWSGDEFGRYRHMSLRGKEEQIGPLAEILQEEWKRILSELSPPAPSSDTQDQNQNQDQDRKQETSHASFTTAFQTWLREKIASGSTILVGGDSEDLLNLIWIYLYPSNPKNPIPTPVLSNRRLCTTTPDNRIAIVPATARPGDQIVYLAGVEIAVVVRKSDLEADEARDGEIISSLSDRTNDGALAALGGIGVEDIEIETCTLVGEAYVDGVVGWSKREAVGEREYVVFAMR